MNQALIEVKNITKIYGHGESEVRALDGVSLKVFPGEFIAIMGPSGSGKSTLAQALALLDSPTTGEYFFKGKQVSTLEEDEQAEIRCKNIGFVFQQFNLLPRMGALENVLLPTFYSKRKNAENEARKLLDQVGLKDREGHRPNELSGGQQQRVAIARALVNDPDIILADEPTGNLDSKSEEEILKILKDLNEQGITIIMVTHEESVASLAKRIIRVRDGKIESDDHLNEEFTQSRNKKTSYNSPSFVTEFFQHLTQALKILVSNKVRTLLSILGVLIGVASVVSMMAIGRGAQEQIQEQMSRLGTNLLVLRTGARRFGGVTQQVGASSRMLPSDAEFLKAAVPNIARISPSITGRVQVAFENRNWATIAEGVWPDYELMRSTIPELGRFISAEENVRRDMVAVIGQTVARELFPDSNPLGQWIKVNRLNFQVIGVLRPRGDGGWRDPNDLILIPLNTAMRRLLGVDFVDSIEIEVSDFRYMAETEAAIIEAMNRRKRVPRHQEADAFRIRNLADIQEAAAQSSRTMSFLLAAVATISLIVGGIGIMNIMLVSVTERTREIGLRKAIGAKRKDVMSQFLIESVMVALSGGILGVLLGVITANILPHFSEWQTSLSIEAMALAFSFSVLIGIVFGIYPARKAAKLLPIQALRTE